MLFGRKVYMRGTDNDTFTPSTVLAVALTSVGLCYKRINVAQQKF